MKIGEDRTCSSEDMIVDRQTHRHTHHNTLLPYWGGVTISHQNKSYQLIFDEIIYSVVGPFPQFLISVKATMQCSPQRFRLSTVNSISYLYCRYNKEHFWEICTTLE